MIYFKQCSMCDIKDCGKKGTTSTHCPLLQTQQFNDAKNHLSIINDVYNGMVGIGGIPSNEEFYSEFIFRLGNALGIKHQANNDIVDWIELENRLYDKCYEMFSRKTTMKEVFEWFKNEITKQRKDNK